LLKYNEFGKISKLIIDFFEQKKLLEKQIIDLNKSHEELTNLSFELLAQKEEFEALNETIMDANDEISAKNAEISWQRDELEIQNNELTESIKYASIIQKAVLEVPISFCSIFPDHFFLLLPRNILSGDFYWIQEHDNKYYIAGADCTGHSLAGALLSMMGVSFLNYMLHRKERLNAAEMLNKLRNYMVNALHQTGEFGEAHGGMDIALTIIDSQNAKLDFAGAFNSIYISKFNKEINNRELLEIKGDKMPVGIYVKESPFHNHEIYLNEGDEIFLASDGIVDQFGGPKNKKLNSRNFKNLLLETSKLPIDNQRAYVVKEYNDWRADNEQTDDIMLLGIVYTKPVS
jgi:serine phosphatase RsbU (regulator of sigma subunit)